MPTDHPLPNWDTRLSEALSTHDATALAEVLEEIHPADLADLFIELEEAEQIAVLDALSDEQAAELLSELEPDERAFMLDQLTVERTSDVLEEMYSDDAADVLAELPHEEVDALLERMEPAAASEVAELLRYTEDTAGGLMAKEFVRVGPDHTVAETLALLRDHYADAEMIYDIYVLDEEERLLGVVSLRALIVHDPETTLTEIMAREYASVHTDQPQDEVAEIVRRHDLLAVPVLDDDGRMRGIVTVDDVGDVVQDEAADDLLAVSGGEEMDETTPQPWVARPGWRSGALALLGALALAALIWAFGGLLTHWTPVAVLLPLLLVLALIAGSQAALAMDHAFDHAVERHQLSRIFLREVLAGAGLALVGGVLAGALLAALRLAEGIVATVLPMTIGLWVASITGAAGATAIRRRQDALSPIAHVLIVVLGLLAAISLYLWLAMLALPSR